MLNSALPSESLTENAQAELAVDGAASAPVGHVLTDDALDLVPPKRWRFLPKWWQKVLFMIFVLLMLMGSIGTVMGFYAYGVVLELKSQGLELREQGKLTYAAFKGQNIPQTQQELKKVIDKFAQIKSTYQKLAIFKTVPIARSYYFDGEHALVAGETGLNAAMRSIEAIAPHADILGFQGEGSFTGGTAEDRLKVLLGTLKEVTPVLDSISTDLKVVESELSQINPQRYPEDFRSIPVRSYIVQGQQVSRSAVAALTEYRPIIEQLPSLAGGLGRKKYLILFQNDNELRPTGGFLTAYATIFVENGKVTPEKSDDIYELDKKFTSKIAIPETLGRYLTTEKRWNLRDMNTSPDFKVSMEQFIGQYKTLKSEPQDIDGIIAVDTKVLTDLIKVLGPIEVAGYGTFTAEADKRCDCPNIIYELSNIITRPTPYLREDRKGIIGPLMRQILTKFYQTPKQQWPLVFEAALGKPEDLGQGGWIGGRNLQALFFDPAAQASVEAVNAAGRLSSPSTNQDFLAIVDANLGGAKSNLFVDSEVKQVVSAPKDGVITKQLEITYKNSRKGDNCNLEAGLLCLNATLRDWHRLYLPKGSVLVESNGFTQTPKQYDEGEFSVIDGFFILEPNSQAKVKVTYTVPYSDASTYKLKLWKQGGINPVKHLLDVNGAQEEVMVSKDTTVEIAF